MQSTLPLGPDCVFHFIRHLLLEEVSASILACLPLPQLMLLLLRLLRPLLASNHQLQHKTIEHQHYISAFYTDFYFESYDTMLYQIQEMLFIERGGKEQMKDELKAYNPLIPNGKSLVTTLMFEIDNPNVRQNFLTSHYYKWVFVVDKKPLTSSSMNYCFSYT